jgi:hypothetical protein
MSKTSPLPRARTEGLVINELTEEVLVYDLKRDKAHCLNHTAAAVWKLCDGHMSAAQIAELLRRQSADGSRQEPKRGSSPTVREGSEIRGQRSEVSDQAMTEQMVWLALEQLGHDHLLEERMSWPAAIPHMSRREAMRRLGIGAAIAVPIVMSITAPLPAQAGTCNPKGATCGTGSQCCSKACVANKCA